MASSSTTQNESTSTTTTTTTTSTFPGFKNFDPKEEYAPIRKALSRLQRRAPRPLQLKTSVSFKSEGTTPKMLFGSSIITPSSSSSSSSLSSSPSPLTSFYQDKDPIPLLSPLVSPSFLDKSCTTKSR